MLTGLYSAVLDLAEAEGFPFRILAMLFLMHSAPRIVMVGDAASRWIAPDNSLVSG